ncbi:MULTISPECIES: winged helix-turn-helix domain-containing protein [Paraburkholderia]|uniref:winged helix-turn-helix domain-containing protein n=1 Tax=Paraburkholderia TaxID=1822464 RepID=UPI00225A434D|nr:MULTISPECIES: winged helix-turn-helix domain-containing protein [Paraburkholderia]MCX4161390.1 winged helix-turn-helix domain-containing protein [Paraburkholderia megapolitana]MDN7156886.1 winged helix-turn-helix domain-containing protein [Paraburkholderia sp. CHISQ3]MDQ6493931.1 winged helix-turn-helix domain-containing protein [Paraburkholderia megapolitana]
MSLPRPTGPVIAFGRYRLLQNPVRLVADEARVDMSGRALELLLALVEARGRSVPLAELARRAWSRGAVDTNTVQAQVSALRRALGADRDLIVTVPGYGYRFAGTLQFLDDAGPAVRANPVTNVSVSTPKPPPLPLMLRMPVRTTPFIGRHAELSELLGLVSLARVVTLAGEAGLGKRRLAYEVARRLAAHVPDGMVAVAFTPQLQADSLADTLAIALRVPAEIGATTHERLLSAIGDRRLLLIVDCCETLRKPAGYLLTTLVEAAPNLRVIATANAPLSIAGEHVVPLGPLRIPRHTRLNASEAPELDALRLLFARLTVLLTALPAALSAVLPSVITDTPGRTASIRSRADADPLAMFDAGRLAPDTLAAAALIARRLDGVPLALELAAAAIARRIPTHTPFDPAVHSFAHDLDRLMAQRTVGANLLLLRSTPLAAVLDLQMAALDDAARTQFRRLGAFPGEFTRASAARLLVEFAALQTVGQPRAVSETSSDSVPDVQTDLQANTQIDTLLDVGLIERIEGDGETTFCLRDPVRQLARNILWQHGELECAAAAHAQTLVPRLAASSSRRARVPGDAVDRNDLGDLRAALDWAVSNDRFEIAIALLDGSEPLWRALTLAQEYLRAIRTALARVDASATRRMRDEMRLRITLARALPLAHAPLDEISAAWQEAYDLANACADSAYRQHALTGLVASLAKAGDSGPVTGEPIRDDRTARASEAEESRRVRRDA